MMIIEMHQDYTIMNYKVNVLPDAVLRYNNSVYELIERYNNVYARIYTFILHIKVTGLCLNKCYGLYIGLML